MQVDLRVLIALLGVAIALATYFSSRRSEHRETALDADRNPDLQLTVVHGAYEFSPDKADVVWTVRVIATNRSDRPTSVTKALCRVQYTGPTGRRHTAILEASPTGSDGLELPFNLGPRSSVAGTLIFTAPMATFGKSTPTSYELAMDDAFGRTTTVDVGLMNREVK